MKDRYEKQFLEHLKKASVKYYSANDESVIEGFEYLRSDKYTSKKNAVKSRLRAMLNRENSAWQLISLAFVLIRTMPSIIKNIAKNYSEVEGYLDADNNRSLSQTKYLATHPNSQLWKQLQERAWSMHQATVGFTELPQEYIFRGKAVPFKYALVFIQEMDKAAIEKAPKLEAGAEVVKVYNSLGIATNDIANWLRKEHSIDCMANHPLGGLVDTVPLAQKAGMGFIGRSGLLITKTFGPRCRISPVFLRDKIFEYTDSRKHSWGTEFCKSCGGCSKACPTSAIYSSPKLYQKHKGNIEDRFQCYDREKCYLSFSATMGCAICIAVCPFSKNPKIYDTVKPKFQM